MKRDHPAPPWLTSLPIAHRGLHNMQLGRAENSMMAFQAAVDAGFAIECDIQMSKGGEPVVFHDFDLTRMTSYQGSVRDKTVQELQKIKLLDTQDTIRPLTEHLHLVKGRVPLILELKGSKGQEAGFVERVAQALLSYQGPVALMSFDHWICARFAQLCPDIPRGLVAEGGQDTAAQHQKAMQEYDLGFISYNVEDLPNRFVKDLRQQGYPVLAWTLYNQEQVQQINQYMDQITFEGFLPS